MCSLCGTRGYDVMVSFHSKNKFLHRNFFVCEKCAFKMEQKFIEAEPMNRRCNEEGK